MNPAPYRLSANGLNGYENILFKTGPDETVLLDCLLVNPGHQGIDLKIDQDNTGAHKDAVIEQAVTIPPRSQKRWRGIILEPERTLYAYGWSETFSAQLWIYPLSP